LQGIALADLIADADRKDALPRLEAAGEIRAAFRALRKDGMPVQVELRGTHGTFQGHPATLILMLDVSE
jgi:hypothetical protein